MAHHDPKSDWSAAVLDEQPVVIKAAVFQKAFDHVGELVERIAVDRRVRHVAVAEAGVVRRDHMETCGKRRNQIAVLVGGSRKAMEQDQLRAGRVACLAIGDVESVNPNGLVGKSLWGKPFRGLQRCRSARIRVVRYGRCGLSSCLLPGICLYGGCVRLHCQRSHPQWDETGRMLWKLFEAAESVDKFGSAVQSRLASS